MVVNRRLSFEDVVSLVSFLPGFAFDIHVLR